MAAAFSKFRTRQERLRSDDAARIRQGLLALELPPSSKTEEARAHLLAELDRITIADENAWTFVMISAEQFDAVLERLMAHATQPKLAARIWSKCFTHLDKSTGQILLTRAQIAEKVGAPVNEVSRVLSLLVEWDALIRHRENGGTAQFFVNPLVGTHLAGKDRERAQAEAPPLKLPNNVAKLPIDTKHSGVVRS